MSDPRYRTKRWRTLRSQAIIRDGHACTIPGCQTDLTRKYRIHVDHITEVKDGGPFWNLNNLQTLCQAHHQAKTIMVRTTRPARVSPNR